MNYIGWCVIGGVYGENVYVVDFVGVVVFE